LYYSSITSPFLIYKKSDALKIVEFVSPTALALLTIFLCADCTHQVKEASNVDALPQARLILGPAQPWVALDLDADRMNSSIKERRKAAWKTVESVLRRVPLSNPQTGAVIVDPRTNQPLSLPLWQTWYEVNEFRDMFADFYWKNLSETQRQTQEAPETLVDQVMASHHKQKLLKKWTKMQEDDSTRFDRLLGQIKSPADAAALNGVSGRGYALFSPALIRHYLLHYGAAYACTGTSSEIVSDGTGRDFATCLDASFPPGAVAVKATWSSATDGIAEFDSSASGIARLYSQKNPTWRALHPESLEHPTSQKIYTSSTYFDDQRAPEFRLTGLHVLTKDIPEWMWVTLWWSPHADEDFGEDRPATLDYLGPAGAESVWNNYKMCTVSSFDEGDLEMQAKVKELDPNTLVSSNDHSLDAALLSAYAFTTPHTACSNPFIEFQDGVAKTNCIGCHQHAGPYSSGSTTARDLARVRKSFMTDFMWSYENPIDSFRGAIRDVIENGSAE
jgi:hypothetical protein